MKKNSIILGLVFIFVFIFGLFGPKLSKGGRGEKLVGSFFTTQTLEDIFPDQGGDNSPLEKDPKIYASLSQGEGAGKYHFPNLEGQWVMRIEEGDKVSSEASPGSYPRLEVREDQGHREDYLENRLYLLGGEERTYFAYPIYRDGEGKVFVRISGDGIRVEGNTDMEESFALSNSQEDSFRGLEGSRSRALKIENKARFLDPIESRKVLEFSKNRTLIREKEIKETIPGEYRPSPKTEFILVEEGTKDKTSRRVYSRGQESMDVFFQEGIYFNKRTIQLIWP